MNNFALAQKKSMGFSQVKVLMIPLTLTVALFGGIGLYIWNSSQAAKESRIKEARIQQLSADIIYLDQTLTMSAQIAATTKNPKWEEQYHTLESKYNSAVDEATKLLPEIFKSETMLKVNDAAKQIFDLEHQAIDLIGQAKYQAAANILFSTEYNQQKQIYAKALAETTNAMKQYVETSIQSQAQQANVAVGVVILALIILLVTWGSVLRTIVKYIGTIKEVETAISTTTVQIVSAVEQQEQLINQQASAVNQTTSTMNELNTCSMTTVEQAEAAALVTKQVLTLVNGKIDNWNSGQTSHLETSLQEKVNEIANQILSLSEQTQQIGAISTLVSDLANQTNMLALNAAVEAVRAGENGKGFSVVANEIRRLADQSKKSAERIKGLVSDIQKAASSTVMVTDEGKKTVDNVVVAINNIALNTQQISLTAKQQAVAIEQVVQTMNNIKQAASESAIGISQTKLGTERLNDAAVALKSVV